MISEITKCDILKRLETRILILDGAMGTSIQEYNLSSNDFNGFIGNNDILNLTRGDIIEDIHRKFIAAGADIIETNTFNANAISQLDYNEQDNIYQINFNGAQIARKAIDGADILIAGAMGPTNKMLSFSPNVNTPELREVDFDAMVNAYMEQARGLIEGGVDFLLVETIYDGLNAKAALYAIDKVKSELEAQTPIMVSVTINDKSGRILSGQQVDALYTSLSHFDIFCFGLNCSFGANDLLPFLEQIACVSYNNKGVPCAVSIYPNAGLPNEMGEYDELPEFTASCLKKIAQKGIINIAGGCCGTTPNHIMAIKDALCGIEPRELRDSDLGGVDDLWVSGLENLLVNKAVNNFINVGERTNVAGSAKFARLIRERNYAEAADIARKQIEDGATIIDINMDDAMLDSAIEMANFVRSDACNTYQFYERYCQSM